MSGNPPVFSRNGAKFPIYIQTDGFPAVYNSLKELIHGCNGVVLDTPDRALAICITNRDTPLGANLIAKYYQADTSQHRRGVVDHHWVNACVDAQTLLGPPSWGGFYLSPLTLDHFFDPGPSTAGSPSLSQAPTLVSPAYTPQYLPTSDGQPPPTSRKPSLPTIPQQILQKFHPPGPPVSPSGYFSSSNATTPFTEDVSSRQVSVTTKASSPIENDPAPAPPPESQKKSMGGARSNSYYYTEVEDDFIMKYATWAERQGIPSSSVPNRISLLMPWHPATGIVSHLSKLQGLKSSKGWTYVAEKSIKKSHLSEHPSWSKYDQLKLGRRPSADQSKSNSTDRQRRTRNNSTGAGPTILPDRLMMWPRNEAPPEAPGPGSPIDPEFGYPFTPEDKVYVVEFTRWAGRRLPDIDLRLLSAALERYAPHHSRAKWFGHMSKYSNQYAKRVPNELAHLFLDVSDDEDEYEDNNRKEWNSSDESDESEDDKVAGPSSQPARQPTSQKAAQKGPGGIVVPYTDEELDGIAMLLVEHPTRSLTSVFTEFAASRVADELHPQRSASAYAQYARTHLEYLRSRGRRLLDSSAAHNGDDINPESDEEVQRLDDDADDENCAHNSAQEPPNGKKHGHKKKFTVLPYTEEELDAMARLAMEDSDKSMTARIAEFAASRVTLGLQPQRKAHSYYEYYRRHCERLKKRGCALLGQQYEPSSEDGLEQSPTTPSPPRTKKPPSPIVDTSDDLYPDEVRLGQSYTEGDYLAVTNFVARHPALFRNSEEGKLISKETLWQKFDQEYPGRSAKAWREFFRKRAAQIEQDALAIIEKKQKSSKAKQSQNVQPPKAPRAMSKEAPKSGKSVRLTLKTADDTKSSTTKLAPPTAERSPGGTKRALSADAATESSMPAAKKLKQQSEG